MRTENIYSVYVHKNLKNDKYYVGSTKMNPKKRWHSGWGYKNNSKMWKDIKESDWNKDWVHGILGKFENKDEALKYEAFLIAMLDSAVNGYNTSEYGGFSCKHSEETRRKMSEALSGEKNPMYGMTGEKAYWYGKHHSEESKEKIRKNNPSKPVLQFSKDGEFISEYPSTQEAERQTGCNHSSICECCKGKRKSCGGFIWQYKSSY